MIDCNNKDCIKNDDTGCSLEYRINLLNDKIRGNYYNKAFNRRFLFGYGNVHSKIIFVGESPSIHGTEEGICPLSRGTTKQVYGDLLNALGQNRESVYTTNLTKWSEPEKYIPEMSRESIEFLFTEISIIQPRYCVVLSSKVSRFIKDYYQRRKIDNCLLVYHKHPAVVGYGAIDKTEYINELKSKLEHFGYGK